MALMTVGEHRERILDELAAERAAEERKVELTRLAGVFAELEQVRAAGKEEATLQDRVRKCRVDHERSKSAEEKARAALQAALGQLAATTCTRDERVSRLSADLQRACGAYIQGTRAELRRMLDEIMAQGAGIVRWLPVTDARGEPLYDAEGRPLKRMDSGMPAAEARTRTLRGLLGELDNLHTTTTPERWAEAVSAIRAKAGLGSEED